MKLTLRASKPLQTVYLLENMLRKSQLGARKEFTGFKNLFIDPLMCLLMVSKSNSNTGSIVLIINSCKNTHKSSLTQQSNTHKDNLKYELL